MITLNDVEGADTSHFAHLWRLNDILPLEDFIRASSEPIEKEYDPTKTTMTLPQVWCARWWVLNFHRLSSHRSGGVVTLYRLPDRKSLKVRPLQLYSLERVMAILPDFSQALVYEIDGEYYRGPEPGKE